MEKITSFFSKFTKLTPPERFVKEKCIEVVKKIASITLLDKDIEIRGETLFITTTPIKKSELFLHKRDILENLTQELKQYKKTIQDIR